MIRFAKAHAGGNDFLIVEEKAVRGHDRAELTRRRCARNTGIGADGVEFFEWTGPKAGRITLHNSDGSIAEIGGNGTRCVAAWMAEELKSKPGDELKVETDAGVRICRVNKLHKVGGFTVDVTTAMGIPHFELRTVKLVDGTEIAGVEVSTGNPHFVILVGNAEFAVAGRSWEEIGAQLCVHPDFPEQTNVEFVRLTRKKAIEIRIFERGVGPTTCSGTGSSASATAALALHGRVSPLAVVAPGGEQTVEWSGPGTELWLTGPTALIARGEAWC